MEEANHLEPKACPACGGAGGGPFGRAGSAWDDEEYVCSRCAGAGVVALDDVMVQSQRPGIAKTVPDATPGKTDESSRLEDDKRKASA